MTRKLREKQATVLASTVLAGCPGLAGLRRLAVVAMELSLRVTLPIICFSAPVEVLPFTAIDGIY